MPAAHAHIPYFQTVADFFTAYRIGSPQFPGFACMQLESQPTSKPVFMPLFRSGFFKVVFFTDSDTTFLLPDRQVAASGNNLYFGHPGKLESWVRRGESRGFSVYFTGAFAGIDPTHSSFAHDYPFFTFEAETVVPVTEATAAELQPLAQLLLSEVQQRRPDAEESIRHLLRAFLLRVRRAYSAHQATARQPEANRALYNRFCNRVDACFTQLAEGDAETLPSVSRIADALHVNASYLNATIKALTGRTASAHLHDRMLLEAEAYLAQSDLQVAEIAHRLGFHNLPYFNRFFKKATGLTPLAFRRMGAKPGQGLLTAAG